MTEQKPTAEPHISFGAYDEHPTPVGPLPDERLVACAIIRQNEDDPTQSRVFHGQDAHWKLREKLGDLDPSKRRRGDVEGFWTSANRFVTREEAKAIGVASGQLHADFHRPGSPEPLSSNVRWNA